jgi:hypothetical protein
MVAAGLYGDALLSSVLTLLFLFVAAVSAGFGEVAPSGTLTCVAATARGHRWKHSDVSFK